MVSKVIRLGHLLWITVLIVRVGCIIEAYASPTDVDPLPSAQKDMHEEFGGQPPTRQSMKRKNASVRRLFRNDAPFSSQAEGGHATGESSSEDTCSDKPDGYFPNYGSDCTSYYFCAAGYQITYVCPPDMRFSTASRKCEDGAPCMPSSGSVKNPCEKKANGYYSKKTFSPKYYYCHNNAKVIDLVCDTGKFFDGSKCTLLGGINEVQKSEQVDNDSCVGKSNGFYPVVDASNADCSKYYYCIGEQKTELKCDSGLVFNGDICVHPTRYHCARKTARVVKFDDDTLYHLSTDGVRSATEDILAQNEIKLVSTSRYHSSFKLETSSLSTGNQ